MKRYVAFLRGVSPLNASMPALKRALERAGFADVHTLLSSGNVVFSIRASSERAVARRAEAAMLQHLGRSFVTFVRPLAAPEALLEKTFGKNITTRTWDTVTKAARRE